jgi:urease accessory protein
MTIEIKSKLKTAPRAYKVEVKGQISLPFETRRRGRGSARLVSGEEVTLALRGELLRGGDLVVASDGRVIEVIAEPEAVLQVECDSPEKLARAAYLLGERHVPVKMDANRLRIAGDHTLEALLKDLGAALAHLRKPFEPDVGAAAASHGHAHGDEHDHHHHHSHDDHHHRK